MKASVDAERDAASKARATADQDQEALEEMRTTAVAANERVTGYEEQLKTLISGAEAERGEQAEKLQTLRDEVTALLPKGASAALATTFADQARKYKTPKIVFGLGFAASLLGFVAMQIWLVEHMTLDSVLPRLFLSGPCVWGAWFCAGRYKDAARISEDYVFKSARAITYQGYRREAESVDAHGGMVRGLTESTLADMARHPLSMADGGAEPTLPSRVVDAVADRFMAKKAPAQRSPTDQLASAVDGEE